MTRLRRTCTALLAAAALAAAPTALAAPEPGHGPPTDAHAAPDSHGDDGHGEEGDHGDAHGAHHYYTDDDDGDGTANWLDPTDNTTGEENELFVLKGLGFHLFNLLLLLGVLVYFLRKPLADTLRNRALDIRKELTESARQRDEAKQRYKEIEARLHSIQQEIAAMQERNDAAAAADEAKLVERAHAESDRIAATAERNIRDEVTRARVALRQHAVELAGRMAEKTLRDQTTREDQQKLAREFLRAVSTDDGEDAHA